MDLLHVDVDCVSRILNEITVLVMPRLTFRDARNQDVRDLKRVSGREDLAALSITFEITLLLRAFQ